MSKYELVIANVVSDAERMVCKHQTLTAPVASSARIGSAYLCLVVNEQLVPLQVAGKFLADLIDKAADDPQLLEPVAQDDKRIALLLTLLQTAKPDVGLLLEKIAAEWADRNREDVVMAERDTVGSLRLSRPIGVRLRVSLSPDGSAVGLLPVATGGVEATESVAVPGWGALRPFKGPEHVRLVRRHGSQWFRGAIGAPRGGLFCNPDYFHAVVGTPANAESRTDPSIAGEVPTPA